MENPEVNNQFYDYALDNELDIVDTHKVSSGYDYAKGALVILVFLNIIFNILWMVYLADFSWAVNHPHDFNNYDSYIWLHRTNAIAFGVTAICTGLISAIIVGSIWNSLTKKNFIIWMTLALLSSVIPFIPSLVLYFYVAGVKFKKKNRKTNSNSR
ncbi:hypothetical protein [Ureaplasma ceti]|uniref:Uncharacterized protein n=1 Tax=Ureaplasma ceti TaxID=3119530 RepID=A0ABP9U5V1_9BACT